MGNKKVIVVNGIAFLTKKVLTLYLRQMMTRYGVGENLEGEDREFCLGLFEFHPDSDLKLISGVRLIAVRLDGCGNKHSQIHRNNGTDDDISWTWCVRHAVPAVPN
jgi:Protein of unknown function (DUF3223)